MWYLRRVKQYNTKLLVNEGFDRLEETVEEEWNDETASSVVEEAIKRSIVSAALLEKYVNIDNKALTFDITADEDIVKGSQKEHINEIETDDEQVVDPKALNKATVALKTMPHFLMQQENASCTKWFRINR